MAGGIFAKIIAAPLRVIAQLVGLVHIADPFGLWVVVWKLSYDVKDGSQVLLLICEGKGIEAARAQADKMFMQCKSAELAVTMAWLEIQRGEGLLAERLSNAQRWIDIAKSKNLKNLQMLLYPELFVSLRQESDKAARVADDILKRNDLPMEVTRLALITKGWSLAKSGRFPQAEEIADRILGVEEDTEARFLKWMGCMKRGRGEHAQKHLDTAKMNLPGETFDIMMAQGWLMLGEKMKAMEWIYKAQQDGVTFPTESRDAAAILANSQEYLDFSRTMER